MNTILFLSWSVVIAVLGTLLFSLIYFKLFIPALMVITALLFLLSVAYLLAYYFE